MYQYTIISKPYLVFYTVYFSKCINQSWSIAVNKLTLVCYLQTVTRFCLLDIHHGSLLESRNSMFAVWYNGMEVVEGKLKQDLDKSKFHSSSASISPRPDNKNPNKTFSCPNRYAVFYQSMKNQVKTHCFTPIILYSVRKKSRNHK